MSRTTTQELNTPSSNPQYWKIAAKSLTLSIHDLHDMKLFERIAPLDPRFLISESADKECYTWYTEYLKCAKELSVSNPRCQRFFEWAHNSCITEMMDGFYESRRTGSWRGYPFPMQPEELREGDELDYEKWDQEKADPKFPYL